MPSSATNTQSKTTRGVFLALAGAIFWGFSASCVSYLTTAFNLDIIWMAWARTAIAGPFFLLVAFATDRQRLFALLHDARSLLHALCFAVVGVVLMQITYMTAVSYLGAGNALLLQELGLILIMLVACTKARRFPAKSELLALGLALFGTAAIATQGNIGSLGISAIGLFWGLATAVSVAGYNIIPVGLLERFGSFVTSGCSITLGCLVLTPMAQPWSAAVALPLEGWMAFFCVVLFGTILAYFVYLQGVKDAGPVKASLASVFEPVSAMVISAVWLGTAISPADLVGCVAIVAMMILVTKPA